ncbi:hypothetical protein [Haloprofundus halobius]|uniref:hypothetical protein n=1 Tax=Haloprofundus halobius TaxID=2876194 RepID=UPI001CC9732C|nr:hypothetical protein [Haloprofundus halobius]
MPSNAWNVPTWLFVGVIVVYFVVIAQRPLFGVLAGTIVYLVGWFVGEFLGEGALSNAFSSTRAAVTAVLAVLVLAYSFVVVQEILLGIVTAAALVAVAWLTSPTGPLVGLRD